MNEALRLDLKAPPLIPAVRVHGEIFSHTEGHDMAMDLACERYGDLPHLSDDDFGYLSAPAVSAYTPATHVRRQAADAVTKRRA